MTRLRVILCAAGLLGAPAAATGEPEPGCQDDPAYHALDFWVGDWEVVSGGQTAGRNRIEEILDGCAILEHWTSAAGGEGRSLFYYAPAAGVWKQVWATTRATRTGGTKEKVQVPADSEGSIRFRGEIAAEGGSYLDLTTLTPRPDGRVRRHLEVSTDSGRTWRTTFDAIYIPTGD